MTTSLAARRHLWIVGPTAAARRAAVPVTATVVLDAHRRHRGPFTAAGDLVRAVVPAARERRSEIVGRHDIGILSVAPELRTLVPSNHETLTSLAPGEERTRFYPRARTNRIAHDLTELLIELASAGEPLLDIVVDRADEADATDVELLAILLRRLDPALVRILVGSATTDLPAELAQPLAEYAVKVVAPAAPAVTDAASDTLVDQRRSAAAYVESDCTSEEPGLIVGYDALPPAERALLHDARAAALAERGELSWHLGAIPFHLEHGTHPDRARSALLAALEHCVRMGFYEAVLEAGERCRAFVDWDRDPEEAWRVTAKVTTALVVLERPAEAEALYDEACERTALPAVHMQAAYGRAMLLTRFYVDAARDHRRAKAWVNTAVAIASQMADAERRAFNTTFNENGLALIEMHLGDLDEALRLVTDGLQRLDRELGPEIQTLHRSVLRYNRAQLLARLRRVDEAIAEYTRCIEADPHHSEYWFERAGLYRRVGRVEAALRDYDAAIRESAPYAEPHYNRADLRLELGDDAGALADFSYALELDPDLVGAYVNRASILLADGDHDGAARDVAAGLERDPLSAHLHCLAGLLAMEAGDAVAARCAFDAALAIDATLVEALANRAVLLFDAGDIEGAIADFGRALELRDDPVVRSNRALAYEHADRWIEAADDYERAASASTDDNERAPLLASAVEARNR